MIRLITSTLRAHRGRLALTLLAVTLSVSFVTASFVLADSLRAVFGTVSGTIYDGVDAEIRAGEGDFDQLESGRRFAESRLDALDGIDGLQRIEPGLGGRNVVFTVGPDGEAIRPTGPPVLTFSFTGSDASPFTVVQGRAPGQGEIAIDTAQAAELDVDIGEIVPVAAPGGVEQFTVSGLVVFGDVESGVTPFFLLFDLSTVQQLLDAPGLIDSASITFEPGAVPTQVLASIESTMPDDLLVANRDELIAEQNSEFGQVIDVIQTALLAFAAITAFVATFVIANTFAVLVGQQRRQIGLLRSIGATGRQAGLVVVTEAALVGLLASAFGIGAGLGLAEGIKTLVESVTTGGFPDGPTRILARTIIAALLVGVGVTVLSAVLPARRAARVSPLEAMRSTTTVNAPTGSVLARLIALVGAPFARFFGASGQLAASAINRDPRRVLNTAMSMVVGLALITAITVLAASYRVTLADSIASDYKADLIVTGDDGVPIPFDAFERLATLPEVDAVSGFGSTEALLAGDVISVGSYQPALADTVVDLGIVDTDGVAPLGEADTALHALVASDFSESRNIDIGDTIAVEFSDGAVVELVADGVFEDDSVVTSDLLIDSAIVAAHARNTDADLGVIRFAQGVDTTHATAAVASALVEFPQVNTETVDEHLAGRQAQAQQLMALANGLLGLTIVIATTGIANTITLSVLERTNELGMLRAIGMTRRQIRSMIRYEASITATVGAGLGIVIGVAIAAITGFAVSDNIITTLRIPVTALTGYLVAGILLGVAAATVPALRASRLKILDALGTVE